MKNILCLADARLQAVALTSIAFCNQSHLACLIVGLVDNLSFITLIIIVIVVKAVTIVSLVRTRKLFFYHNRFFNRSRISLVWRYSGKESFFTFRSGVLILKRKISFLVDLITPYLWFIDISISIYWSIYLFISLIILIALNSKIPIKSLRLAGSDRQFPPISVTVWKSISSDLA